MGGAADGGVYNIQMNAHATARILECDRFKCSYKEREPLTCPPANSAWASVF